jgi:hypothetical protein
VAGDVCKEWKACGTGQVLKRSQECTVSLDKLKAVLPWSVHPSEFGRGGRLASAGPARSGVVAQKQGSDTTLR